MKKCLLFSALMFCFATVSQSVEDVLQGPNGPVEFVGLKNWTAPKLFEAIKGTAEDMGFHACAAVMKSDLDFSDAAVFVYFDSFEDGSWQGYTVVVGVEDSSGVQYRKPGNETIELPESWQKLKSVAEEDFNTVSTLVYARYLADEAGSIDKAKELAVQLGANPETSDEVWKLVGNIEERDGYRPSSGGARQGCILVIALRRDNSSWTNAGERRFLAWSGRFIDRLCPTSHEHGR